MHEDKSFSWRAKDGSRIRVAVEPSYMWPNVCRFLVDPPVYPEGAIHLRAGQDATLSPLARKIFELGGVSEVLIAGDSVTVTTDEPVNWQILSEKVASTIREQVDSGTASVSPEHARGLPSSEEIRRKVEDLLDSTVAPAVASHGGRVALLDVRANNVYLEFGGGCQGCGMAHVTLKHGVERLIREQIPEVGLVLDTTDHAGGKNPYYAPQGR
jgi:Fe-S cluster biogenesis protein NfuA